MADAAIGATIEVVLGNVLSLANDRIDLVLGFKEELARLSKTAEMIKGFVADADDKKHSQWVLLWLKDLEGEAFKAENVLDEVNYEKLRREVKYRSQLKRKVCFFFSFFGTIGFRSRMASKIRDINTNLERINQDASKFELVTRYHNEAALSAVLTPAVATTRRQTDFVVVPNVVGRANDESKIVEMLLNPSDKIVSVIPIVGMGGLGKTTLAKSVYNDPKIDGHFDKKIWVCLAEQIEILELFKFILESLTTEKVEEYRRNTIIQKIQENLGGKRYFLVLDDVWNNEQGLWEDFFSTLEGLNTTKGSWCLATTRLEPVANTMSRHLKMNVGLYKLGKLSDDECWSILKGKVVAGEEVPIELKAIKMQILRRCGGLPLSAKLIGGLLLNKEKEEWRYIVEESLLNVNLLNVDKDDVKLIIKMSFDHLPSTSVKKCFVYCSLFPQDTELDKNLLIELWMAEGFIQPDSKNESSMEAIGDDCLGILLRSSLLEEVTKWGETCYKMHDLVHDFAKSALNEDRYLALTSSQGMAEDIIKKNSSSLRTLFLESSISVDILSKFECLHVLKLFGEDVKVLPDSIGKLIHLQFLDISDSQITKLPKSLCKLYNLQTMRIKDGKLEEGLPKQMSNLIGLRHLHYSDTRADFQMPSKMGRLTRLQTLEFFNIGQENGSGIEELGNLKDLKGLLVIRNLELVTGKEGAEKAKLFEKSNLFMLTYLWGSGDRDSNNCDENILEGLQPPQNLKFFEISNFMGDRFPGWFINLSTLLKLKFTDCKRCRELPALGQLPSLERLELRGLENIRSIGLSFYGIRSGGGGGGQVRKFFPALKYLSLSNMVNLVDWKDEDEVKTTTGAAEVDLFPVLEDLNIENCSRLTSAPSHFPSIENLEIRFGCRVSLLKRIVNCITSLSSVVLTGNIPDEDDSHSDEHIEFLSLRKRRHSNNFEADVEHDLYIDGCEGLTSLPGEMLKSCASLQQLKISHCCGWISLLVELLKSCASLQQLEISRCGRLTSLPREMLKSCASLQQLKISYCDVLTNLPGEMLKSCASLQQLEISYCDGLTNLPGEMLKSCASLQQLFIFDCGGLTSLPGEMLKSCASLQQLKISRCGRLTSLPGEMLKSCVSLQQLVIFDCGRLTSLPGEMLKSCASLQQLVISSCGGLTSLPGEMLKSCASLYQLEISGCGGLTSLPGEMLKSCASLQQLEIGCCRGLTSLPGEMLKSCGSLQQLEIAGCRGLASLPGEMLKSCVSLQELKICGCHGLTSLPGEILKLCASLQQLEISCCDGLTSLPGEMLKSCASLQQLKISYCDGLTSLPGEMLKSCASLQQLEISRCGRLISLPGEMLNSCASLQQLVIFDCGGLTSLPGDL